LELLNSKLESSTYHERKKITLSPSTSFQALSSEAPSFFKCNVFLHWPLLELLSSKLGTSKRGQHKCFCAWPQLSALKVEDPKKKKNCFNLSCNFQAWSLKALREVKANSLASAELQRILKNYTISGLYRNSKHTNIKEKT